MLIFPRIESERLILRKITLDDLDALVNLANNRSISDQIVNIPYPYTHLQPSMRLGYVNKGFEEKTRFVFAIAQKETDAFIGEMAVHINNDIAEVAYWLGESFWRQGLATEALCALIGFVRAKLNVKQLRADTKCDNVASQRVLLANDFELKQQTKFQHFYTLEMF